MSSSSKYGGSSSGGSSKGAVEGSVSPPATEGVAQRRRRKANFSSEEVDVLVREVSARRHVLFGPSNGGGGTRSDLGSAADKASEKLTAWRAVAACVNAASKGEHRTVREIRKKWENVTSAFRKRQLGGETNNVEPAVFVSPDRFVGQEERSLLSSQKQQFNFNTEENKEHGGGYSSSEDDLILDIQPDVHIEAFETPLIFSDSDEISSKTDVVVKNKSIPLWESMLQFEAGGSTESTSGVPRQFCSKQLLQLQQQLLSGEVNISTAVGRRQERQQMSKQPSSRASSSEIQGGCEEQLTRSLDIEQQKLAVMKQLLKVETKRLKVERKRLKIEKARLKLLKKEET